MDKAVQINIATEIYEQEDKPIKKKQNGAQRKRAFDMRYVGHM